MTELLRYLQLSSPKETFYSPNALENDLQAALEISHFDFLTLQGARIFITGGTGYIGRWLVEALCYANVTLDLKLRLTLLTRNPERFAERCPHLAGNPCVSLLEGDVRTFAYPGQQFSHLIHAATDVERPLDGIETFDVTVSGTKHVLEFAATHDVKRMLILSSGAVYGQQQGLPSNQSERLPCHVDVKDPKSAYGLGKIATEWLANVYSSTYGFDVATARVYAQIGPNMPLNSHFAAGNFIRDAINGESIVIKGDGLSVRSYMYSSDLVTWLIAILVRGESRAAFNVGSDHGISIRELAEAVLRTTGGKNREITVLGRPTPGAAPPFYVPNISAANRSLGLSIRVPVHSAIAKTVAWHEHQRKQS